MSETVLLSRTRAEALVRLEVGGVHGLTKPAAPNTMRSLLRDGLARKSGLRYYITAEGERAADALHVELHRRRRAGAPAPASAEEGSRPLPPPAGCPPPGQPLPIHAGGYLGRTLRALTGSKLSDEEIGSLAYLVRRSYGDGLAKGIRFDRATDSAS